MQSGQSNESPMSFLEGFKTVEERIKSERALRLENGARGMGFGVAFLDDSLGGIYPNDLLLVGAKTGFGKSQLAMLVTRFNASQGKRVHFFALEAEEYEIERRLKYQSIADHFFADPNRPRIQLNYMDWYYGKLDKPLAYLEEKVDADKYPGLNVYYRSHEFMAKDFERLFLGIKDQTDLVVIDHLHYFDLDDENENRAIKTLVKKIRDTALITGKPVILIAHVRKSDKRAKQLIPDIEDFHGSSDIGKIATKAITIAPCYDKMASGMRGTYMQVLKCRVDGARTNATALCGYNFKTQRYESDYFLGNLSSDGTEFKAFEQQDLPPWASRAKNVF